MSKWYEAKDDDISFENLRRNAEILVTSNDCGNIYLILTFEQIENMYNELQYGQDNNK